LTYNENRGEAMILSSETTSNDAQQMLDYYKQHFAVVDVVSCSKCGSFLALECSGGDGMGLAPNELGKYVISVGDNLLSHRVRLDEAPTGERMVGYQCGAPVPNPVYTAIMQQWEEDKDAYQKSYEKDIARAEKVHAKAVAAAKKQGQEEPVYVAPAYLPPEMPAVSETVDCGNDTRISEVERGLVPVGGTQTTLSPFEKHQIRQKIVQDKTYKPHFLKKGNIKHFETFQVERVT
jgi:hypothetical protein